MVTILGECAVPLGGGHWGIIETAKPKKKSFKTAKLKNRKTAKIFAQNRKPHTKLSRTDATVTSTVGITEQTALMTNFFKVFLNCLKPSYF